ncbi:MAG: GNAT family N-acetyltransferase [bacterium]|nr:GNAT family N-acetyltransferase [bacterium]
MFFYLLNEDTELRILTMDDADRLFELLEANRLYLREWLPWVDKHKTINECKSYLKLLNTHFKNNKALHCGIWYQSELAGVVGMDRIDWPNKTAEIGYWIGEIYQGKGLVTLSVRFLIEFAFVELGLNRIEIRCAPDNHRSRGIPERLDFRQEGRLRQAEWLYDRFVDHIMYSILKEDWENNHDPQFDLLKD